MRATPGGAVVLGARVARRGACAGPREQIVEDRFDIAESSRTPERHDDRRPRRRRRAAAGARSTLGGVRRRGRHRRDAVDPRHAPSGGSRPSPWAGGPRRSSARTRDGGILVRVPPLTPSGSQAGRRRATRSAAARRPITVRRYAAVLGGDGGRDRLGRARPRRSGRRRRHAGAGRAACWRCRPTGAPPTSPRRAARAIDVIDVAAQRRAQDRLRSLELGKEPVVALAAAARAPGRSRSCARATSCSLDVDARRCTRRAARRARSRRRSATPASSRADLSPDGKLLAIASEAGNRVALARRRRHGRARRRGLAGRRCPTCARACSRDVAFSPVGDTLWVAPATRRAAARPARSRRRSSRRALEAAAVAARVTLDRRAHGHDQRRARRRAAVDAGRTMPLASGSAIRLPPERTTVFLAAADAHARRRREGRRLPRRRRGRRDDDARGARPLRTPGSLARRALAARAGLVAPDGAVRLFAARADGARRASRARSRCSTASRAPARPRRAARPPVRVQP